MKLNRFIATLVLLIGWSHLSLAQYEGIDSDYYLFPIQPDKVNFLSGTMGELRATHFHAGLDIKTNGKEGLKVYAAADGYVSRIRVATGGYGNSVYIQHPNGTSTVYAHLQRFDKELAEYVLENQYKKESFDVNLFPQRNQFKVKKGEVIGLSGNSGSSSGPHLHFEIRNSKQEVLDPLRMGFDQIRDNIAPIPLRVALKTLDIDSRVNGEFGRFEFELVKKGNDFIIPDTIAAFGKIGVEIWAHDKLDGAANRNGIPKVRMYINRDRVFSQDIDNVNFSAQKNILVHTNYSAQKQSRRRYNKLYIDDGNTLEFYDKADDQGRLSIDTGSNNNLLIRMTDAYDNQREVSFVISGVSPQDKINKEIRALSTYKIQDNTLMLYRPSEDSGLENVTVYVKDQSRVIAPSYSSQGQHIYLWDLRKGLPDSVVMQENSLRLMFNDMVPSNVSHSYLDNTYALRFEKTSLFDTMYLSSRHYAHKGAEFLEVNNDIQPLKRGFQAELEPLLSYDSLEQHFVYKVNDAGESSFVGGKWENGVIKFSVQTLGKFTLMKDEDAPKITELSRNENTVRFRIRDEQSGIQEFRAEIDGKWLLMNYDAKRRIIWAERRDKTKALKGDFSLKVKDNAGNESIINLKL